MRRVLSTVLVLAFVSFVSPTPVVFTQQQTGGVTGTAADSAKNPLADHTVRVRNLANNQIVSTTQSAANGSFSFTGLTPGNYIIEIVAPGPAGTVVATSATVSVSAGATATITVTATALAGAAGAAAGAGGLAGLFTGTSLIIVTAAGVAATLIVVEATQEESSPSR